MVTHRALKEAMLLIARAQSYLREANDPRADREVELLDKRLVALARIRETTTGGRK